MVRRLLSARAEPRSPNHEPIELEPVELFASRLGWFAGAVSLVVGAGFLSGLVVAAVVSTRLEPIGLGGRILMVVGVVIAAPGLVMLSWIMGVAGVHLLRSRQGSIAFDDALLVISDRWMLTAPMSIDRRDVVSIERLTPMGFLEYSIFASKAGHDLADSGSLLDWGTRPNFRITFSAPRQFHEAIRTLPARTPIQPVSRYRPDQSLLIRVSEPAVAAISFQQWLRATAAAKRTQRAPAARKDPARFGLLAALSAIGFLCFCIGPLF